MSDTTSKAPATDVSTAEEFLDKWRARWPEWRIARVFVAQAQQPLAEAWFALLQEWADAAWAGEDAMPGLAKLSWWQDELLGWRKGARRHPLGLSLHKQAAPWARLSAALPALHHGREALRRFDTSEAVLRELRSLADCIAECEAVLFAGGDAPTGAPIGDEVADAESGVAIAASLAAARLWCMASDEGGDAAAFARVLSAAPSAVGTPPRRVFDAIVRARVARVVAGRGPGPAAPMRVLWSAWRAARG